MERRKPVFGLTLFLLAAVLLLASGAFAAKKVSLSGNVERKSSGAPEGKVELEAKVKKKWGKAKIKVTRIAFRDLTVKDDGRCTIGGERINTSREFKPALRVNKKRKFTVYEDGDGSGTAWGLKGKFNKKATKATGWFRWAYESQISPNCYGVGTLVWTARR